MRGNRGGIELARDLRANPTRAEKDLWRALRGRRLEGFKFRRQAPIDRYIADFVCFEAKLVIEIDGPMHADHADYDAGRTAVLEGFGYRVVRIADRDVLDDLERVVEGIRAELRLAQA